MGAHVVAAAPMMRLCAQRTHQVEQLHAQCAHRTRRADGPHGRWSTGHMAHACVRCTDAAVADLGGGGAGGAALARRCWFGRLDRRRVKFVTVLVLVHVLVIDVLIDRGATVDESTRTQAVEARGRELRVLDRRKPRRPAHLAVVVVADDGVEGEALARALQTVLAVDVVQRRGGSSTGSRCRRRCACPAASGHRRLGLRNDVELMHDGRGDIRLH